jgi:hypothetical protein
MSNSGIWKKIPFESLPSGSRISLSSKGTTFIATIDANGMIQTSDGIIHKSPSAAACHVLQTSPMNGWKRWKRSEDGTSLSDLRAK